jgi:CO dehydrogenase/acetyl-CoA synthase epsilon subunit
MFVGFMLVFGSVGGMDNSTDSDLLLLLGTTIIGMVLMLSGLKAMKEIE